MSFYPKVIFVVFVIIVCFSVLRFKLMVSHMLSKHSIIELHPQPMTQAFWNFVIMYTHNKDFNIFFEN
jgi:hypothetical protein